MTEQTSTPKAVRPQCGLAPATPRQFDDSVAPGRAEIIMSNSKFWVNGTCLQYYFYTDDGRRSDANGAAEMDLVRKAFDIWKEIGIGLDFKETNVLEDAHFRIAFMRGKGSWSFLGRDCLTIGNGDPTMNFGWNLVGDERTFGVAMHEIGHALGFPHEHQNPNSGIVWNEAAVLAHYTSPPNSWSEAKTRANVLDKLTQSDVNGTSWDPLSIMEYDFAAELISAPAPFNQEGVNPPGNKLSQDDITWTRKFYPPLKNADYTPLAESESTLLNVASGEQANFRFTPNSTRDYEIRLFGQADSVVVVFEQREGGDKDYLVGKDDSGTDQNAYLKLPLQAGKTYLIKARMLYKEAACKGAIMVW